MNQQTVFLWLLLQVLYFQWWTVTWKGNWNKPSSPPEVSSSVFSFTATQGKLECLTTEKQLSLRVAISIAGVRPQEGETSSSFDGYNRQPGFMYPGHLSHHNSDKAQHVWLPLLEVESSECQLSLGQQSHWTGCCFFLYIPFLNLCIYPFQTPSADLDTPVCVSFRYSTVWRSNSSGGSTTHWCHWPPP